MGTSKIRGTRFQTNQDSVSNAAEVETIEESTVRNSVGVPLILFGPALTALAMIGNRHAQVFSPPGTFQIGLVTMVGWIWLPFSLSIPGALLQSARDSALNEWGASSSLNPMNVLRLIVLTPYLMFSRHSAVRPQMNAAVVGWFAGLAIVAMKFH